MKNHRWLTVVFALVLSSLIFVVPVMAATIVIDANWSDWDGVLTLLDSAPDDWNSPQPTDLTEFGAVLEDGSTGGVNIVMAVDNTVMDNQGITQGVTITGANGRYFRFYASAIKTSNADLTPLITDANISLYECVTIVTDNQGNVISTTPDPTCTDQEVVCNGTCAAIDYAYDTTWSDPWPVATYTGRDGGDCNEDVAPYDNCLTYDLAVELFIPWTYLGYSAGTYPPNASAIFMQYATYPSSPSVAEKDTNVNGIYCINEDGVYNCYPSTPTAIEGLSFSASSRALPVGLALSGLGLALIGGVLLTVYLRRRAGF